jgi:hypothetical protein
MDSRHGRFMVDHGRRRHEAQWHFTSARRTGCCGAPELASRGRRGRGQRGGADEGLTGARPAVERRPGDGGRWQWGASHLAGAREWDRA